MSEVFVNDTGVAAQIDLTACITELKPSSDSAITQWINDVILITQLSTSLMPAEHDTTVAQMLIATMVSSTENYFRTVLADLTHACPWTAQNVAQNEIPFASVHTFQAEKIGYGLVEGALFSSKGTIANQLKRFTKYKVSEGTAMAKAIAAFDSVCAIRHASVHWSGRFDTRAHSSLAPDMHRRGQHCLRLDLATVQDCLAACDFLVRLTNQTIFDRILDVWLNQGYLGVDIPEKTARARARQLSATFAEERLKGSVTKGIMALTADEP